METDINKVVSDYIEFKLKQNNNNYAWIAGNLEALLVMSLRGDKDVIQFMKSQMKQTK